MNKRTAEPHRNWAALSRAERDAAYNNNAAVPDSADLIARRDEASAQFRAAHPGGLDKAYGPYERNAFDLYPAADATAPCLIFVHGGYWQRNSREVFAAFAEGLTASGWSVAIPSHRLAPDVTLDAIVTEIAQAIDWLAGNGAEHGIAGPLVLSGWSAGGHLTAMHLDHPKVVAGLAISGIYELGPLRDTFLDQALRLSDEAIETLSPLRLPVVAKPLAIAYGTAEVPALVHDSRAFHAMRAAAHAPGPLIPVAGADHFSILEEFRRPDGLLCRAARDLMDGMAA
ncbi:alpha/beta hydrolase [Marinivivus vitaminiproducens]|uniref:alpha/beta hydrolase n=1 Tax=Marinivivus vitaminiproducens TaxID=3035935 RepID=UPI002797F385|nr:alpha/beta hydrolase [Geminicoccaceae bacterium SCSIO 64248]